MVKWDDFERALIEIQPKFGANNEELTALYWNGVVSYGKVGRGCYLFISL